MDWRHMLFTGPTTFEYAIRPSKVVLVRHHFRMACLAETMKLFKKYTSYRSARQHHFLPATRDIIPDEVPIRHPRRWLGRKRRLRSETLFPKLRVIHAVHRSQAKTLHALTPETRLLRSPQEKTKRSGPSRRAPQLVQCWTHSISRRSQPEAS